MNILVTGGTGFLGLHLTKALLAQHHHVRILGRDFTRVASLIAAGATPVLADLRDEMAVRHACQGVDIVYHVGALSAAWGKRADFYAINVSGTQSVIVGCQQCGVRRLIYISSPSVVFDGKDQYNVTENIPYPRRFASVYSLTKKLGEDLVNAASGSLNTVIIRPKAIFGPGDRTLLPQLIAAARHRRLPQIGDGHNLVDLTYVDNVVHALLLALDAHTPSGKTYTITNNEHIPLWGVIRQTLQRLNLPTNLRQISLTGALAAAALMETRALVTGQEPLLTRYSAAILARTQTYDITAAQRDLDYTPQISIAQGIAHTVATLKGEA
jgi:2-alkyl-3-oxoalkanoate reductase